MDACHSGGFWGGNDIGGDGDLERFARTGFLASASENKNCYFDGTNGLLFFSTELAAGLSRLEDGTYAADRGRDGTVTTSELRDYAFDQDHLAQFYGMNLPIADWDLVPVPNTVLPFEYSPVWQRSDDWQETPLTSSSVGSSLRLTVGNTNGGEGTPVALPITANLQGGSGQGALSIVIAGVPAGAALSGGTDTGNGVWSLTTGDLAGLTVTTADDGNFVLTVTANLHDVSGVVTTSVTQYLSVVVNNVAPTGSLSTNGPVTYGEMTIAPFSAQSDPADADASAGFRYAFSLDPDALAFATYANSGTDPVGHFSLTAGTHVIYARIIDKDDGYSQVEATVTVAKATPTITWADPPGIIYGTPLGGNQLNATVAGPGPAPSGAVSYTPGVGTILGAVLHQALTVSVAGTENYNPATKTVYIDVAKALLTIRADDYTRAYGVANPAFTASYTGFVPGEGPAVLGGSLTFSTTAVPSSALGRYAITPGGLTSGNYAITFADGALTVCPAPLSATGRIITATAGAPFSKAVAAFANADLFGSAASYTATITWGDGTASAGTITPDGSGVFLVTGNHTYADPGSYAVSVEVRHVLGYTTTAVAGETATVTDLGQAIQDGQSAGIGFWHNVHGQALIRSFNGGATATTLAHWLAGTFPNLYGVGAGTHNLIGWTNAQVGAFFHLLFDLPGPKLDAQVLATALNVYATTLSLGGTAGQAYGFTVSTTGLGARSYNVGSGGASFGVANGTTLNVYQILKAADRRSVGGVLYGGDLVLRHLAIDVFQGIN